MGFGSRKRIPNDFQAALVTKALLAALMAIGTEYGTDLQLDQLLQAVAHQFGNQLPGAAAIQ